MWSKSFESRLKSWTQLRTEISQAPCELALQKINSWWALTPWVAYYLHWDDKDFWPDPWQLLDENIYCDLARGLGIMYTLMLAAGQEFADARLVEYQNQNIVLVQGEKYILNSSQSSIVNTNHKIRKHHRCVCLEELKSKFI